VLPKDGGALAQRHRGIGVGSAGQRIVGRDVVGAGGVRQRRGHGGRHGVVGEAQRRRAGQPCGIGLGGGDGLRTLGQPGRGEGPDAGGIGGGAAKDGGAFATVTVALASAVPGERSLAVTLLAPVEVGELDCHDGARCRNSPDPNPVGFHLSEVSRRDGIHCARTS